MPRFLIEREIAGAGSLTEPELIQIARTSCAVVDSLGVPYRWITSYVTADRMYCVHEAEDAEAVVEHARRSGVPADVVAEVTAEIGPHTAGLTATTR